MKTSFKKLLKESIADNMELEFALEGYIDRDKVWDFIDSAGLKVVELEIDEAEGKLEIEISGYNINKFDMKVFTKQVTDTFPVRFVGYEAKMENNVVAKETS